MHLYKELQPVDRLSIRIPFPLSSYERKLITLLYQPLVGPEPVSLYFMFWAEGEDIADNNLSHYHLMNALSMPIGKVFESRIALEAIGLLRTYRKDTEESRHFVYDVLPPLDAPRFFEDPLLSMFLVNRIGERAYIQLKERFVLKGPSLEGFSEVSRSFTDVYKPIQQHMPENVTLTSPVEKPKNLPFHYEQFDFQLLRQGLSEQLVPASLLTTEVKEQIAKMAFMYNLTAIDMQKVIIMALDDTMTISEERLQQCATDYYKMTTSKEVPTMRQYVHVDVQELPKEIPNKADMDHELIEWFEVASPLEVLGWLAKGNQPFQRDIELTEDLVNKYKVEIPVVNVLLHYVAIRNKGQLNRNYVETVASSWRSKGVTTAAEAMKLARDFEQKAVKKNQAPLKPSVDVSKQYALTKAAAWKLYNVDKVKGATVDVADVEGALLQLFTQVQPLQLLQILNNGQELFQREVDVVTKFQAQFNFSNDLMNALLHYAYFTIEGNLNSGYLESIAGAWRKANITTAKAAIQHNIERQKAVAAKYYKTSYSKKAPETSKKPIPDWFYKQKEEQQEKQQDKATEEAATTDYEQRRRQILESLKTQGGQ